MSGLKDFDRRRRKLGKKVGGFITGQTYADKVQKGFEVDAQRRKEEEELQDVVPMPSENLIDESKRNSRRKQKARRGRRSTILTSMDD